MIKKQRWGLVAGEVVGCCCSLYSESYCWGSVGPAATRNHRHRVGVAVFLDFMAGDIVAKDIAKDITHSK